MLYRDIWISESIVEMTLTSFTYQLPKYSTAHTLTNTVTAVHPCCQINPGVEITTNTHSVIV